MSAGQLWVERGGAGPRLAVLLHGLGATGAVWHGVAAVLAARGWRWLAPDLRGHGMSASGGPFGFGNHAADVSALLADEDMGHVAVLGHSFGGVVGAVLASGLFGPVPARLVTLGVKLEWSASEIGGAQAMAARPASTFATRIEAEARYLKVSGLAGLVPEAAPEAARGVRAEGAGFALAMDNRVFGAVGPSVPDLMRAAKVPLSMAAGSADPMVTLDAMRQIDPQARVLDGLPHNAHVAAPAAVADLLG